jgi:hypothetical protein
MLLAVALTAIGLLFAYPALAASTTGDHSPRPNICGIPIDFVLLGLTLLATLLGSSRCC